MHMNNARYPNMLCDYMDINDVARIKGISLSFLHESAFGDILTVYGCNDDNRYYFKTVNENGDTCLTAEILVS